jgi:hypothetical protein
MKLVTKYYYDQLNSGGAIVCPDSPTVPVHGWSGKRQVILLLSRDFIMMQSYGFTN